MKLGTGQIFKAGRWMSTASIAALLVTGIARGDSFTYSDFSDVSSLTLNSSAAQVGSVLRVVPNTPSLAGTAYRTTPIFMDWATAFSTAFEFNIATPTGDPTDGFSFILQNQGVNAVGGAGQGSGYVGLSPSVAVLFRGRAPAFVGVIANGVDPLPGAPTGATTHKEGDFYNANEFAWIDYDPATTLLSVFLAPTSTKPLVADMSTAIDVAGFVGSQAFVGFGAGTGGAAGDNDILSWSFTSSQIPEPATGACALGLLAVVAWGSMAKRR